MLLALHNLTRWAVLLLAVNALLRSLRGINGQVAYDTGGRRAVTFFVMSVHAQFLIGLGVWAMSPIVHDGIRDIGTAMRTPALRYFLVEHPTIMLLAVFVATMAGVIARRGPDDEVKHRRAAIGVALALGLIFAGMPWSRGLLPRF